MNYNVSSLQSGVEVLLIDPYSMHKNTVNYYAKSFKIFTVEIKYLIEILNFTIVTLPCKPFIHLFNSELLVLSFFNVF